MSIRRAILWALSMICSFVSLNIMVFVWTCIFLMNKIVKTKITKNVSNANFQATLRSLAVSGKMALRREIPCCHVTPAPRLRLRDASGWVRPWWGRRLLMSSLRLAPDSLLCWLRAYTLQTIAFIHCLDVFIFISFSISGQILYLHHYIKNKQNTSDIAE